MRVLRLALVGFVVGSLAGPPAAHAVGFAQVAGSKGCYADADAKDVPCTKVRSLENVVSAAVSSDGRSLYAAVRGPVERPRDEEVAPAAGVTSFDRDGPSGALTWRACVTDDGTRGPDRTVGDCADGNHLRAISGVALTPDGRSLITIGGYDPIVNFFPWTSSVGVFVRDPQTGELLRQAKCLSDEARLSACSSGRTFNWPSDVVTSPDGRDVYVTAYKGDAVVRYERTAAGDLVQRECISNDGSDGACAKGSGLRGPVRILLSGDGRSAYVLGHAAGSIAVLDRDPETGVLRKNACLMSGEPGACQPGPNVGGLRDAALSASGDALYVLGSSGVRTFARNTATGALTRGACLASSGNDPEDGPKGCTAIDDFSPGGGAIAISGDRVFVFSPEVSAYDYTDDDDPESYVGYTVDTLWAFRSAADGALRPDGCLASAPNDRDEKYTGKCSSGLDVGNVRRMISSDGPLYMVGSRISLIDSAAALAARMLSVNDGRASVVVSCPRAASRRCAGTMQVRVRPRGSKPGHISRSRHFNVRGGHKASLPITVQMKGLAARSGTVVLRHRGLREVRTPVVFRRTDRQRPSRER